MASSTRRAPRKAPAKTTGAELATIESLLPDLVQTSAADFDVDSRDIQAPRIKAASPASEAVAAELVPLYSLYSQHGKDDEDPQVLVQPVKDPKAELAADPDLGLKVYVLKMYKNLSASVNPHDWNVEQRQGGELRTWADNDPSAPPFARLQYNYTLYVPESEEADMPHNLLLKSTSINTARQINTLLIKRLNDGLPLFTTAFRLWPEKREREKDGQVQRWAVIRARDVDADIEEVRAANTLAKRVSSSVPETVSASSVEDTAPAI